jgi:hypothetical protein
VRKEAVVEVKVWWKRSETTLSSFCTLDFEGVSGSFGGLCDFTAFISVGVL